MPQGRGRQRLLADLFRRTQVAELKQLCRALKTTSRVTVFRTLRAEGYLTSYSHAGKYYTLDSIPNFDARGLWFWRDVGFSMHGTLRATIVAKVKEAPGGHTHDELQALLQLRVQDTLRDLVGSGLIGREPIDDVYVYVDTTPGIAKAQVSKRRAMTPPSSPQPIAPATVIEILLVVIRKRTVDASKIAAMLQAKGVVVTEQQVADVLTENVLGKKTKKSPSRRSRT